MAIRMAPGPAKIQPDRRRVVPQSADLPRPDYSADAWHRLPHRLCTRFRRRPLSRRYSGRRNRWTARGHRAHSDSLRAEPAHRRGAALRGEYSSGVIKRVPAPLSTRFLRYPISLAIARKHRIKYVRHLTRRWAEKIGACVDDIHKRSTAREEGGRALVGGSSDRSDGH